MRRNVRDELEVLLDHALVELTAAWRLADPAAPASDRDDPRHARLAAIDRRARLIARAARRRAERTTFEAAIGTILTSRRERRMPLHAMFDAAGASIEALHDCGFVLGAPLGTLRGSSRDPADALAA